MFVDIGVNMRHPALVNDQPLLRFHLRRPAEVILDFRGTLHGRVRANGRALPAVTHTGAHIRVPASALRLWQTNR